MGVCGVKHPQAQSVNEVPQNQRILRLYQQYQQVFQITHHLNVNHKYSSYITLIPDKFVGTGIKRTNLYTTKLSKEEWNDKRKEFWESRLESEAPYWHAIRQAVEEKEECKKIFHLCFFTAQSLIILANADLKLINNSLQLLYNSQGQKFDVPVFMINEPQQFPTVKFCDANIIQNFNEDSFQVKIRSSKFPTDISIEISTKESIVELKQKVQEIAKVGACRLFLSGRELHDHHQVGNYSISNGTVSNNLQLDNLSFYVIQQQNKINIIKFMNPKLRLCPIFKHSSKLTYKMTSKEEFKIERLLEFKNQLFEISINNVPLKFDQNLKNALEQHPLRNLVIVKCQLTKLDMLPKIKSLESLFLDDNRLKEDQLQNLEYYNDKIELLSLMSNRINFTKLQDFVGQLKYMTKLKILNVVRNYFHKYKQKAEFDSTFYVKECRQKFFQQIPTLLLLDGFERRKNKTEQLDIFENSQEEAYYLGLRLENQVEEGEFFYDSDNQEEDSLINQSQEQSNLDQLVEQKDNNNSSSQQQISQDQGQSHHSQGSSQIYGSSQINQDNFGASAFQQSGSLSHEKIQNKFVNDNENKDQNSKQMEDQSEDIPNGSKKKSDDKSSEHKSIKNDSLSTSNKGMEKQQQKQIYAIRDIQSESEQKKPKRKKKPSTKQSEKQNHSNKKNGKNGNADRNNKIGKSVNQKNSDIRRSRRLRTVSNDDKQKQKKVKQ